MGYRLLNDAEKSLAGVRRLFQAFLIGVNSLFLCPQKAPAEINSICKVENAVYKPTSLNESRQKLYVSSEGNQKSPHLFFYFNYYSKNGDLLQQMRMAYVCSNGASVCRASAYYGQIGGVHNLHDFKTTLNFEVVALDKNFRLLPLSEGLEAPYAIILPNARTSFYYNDWSSSSEYTRLYTKNPDPRFVGEDVWTLTGCSDHGEIKTWER